ncbi:hypothetical protein [Azospirillum sp. sgz301742]
MRIQTLLAEQALSSLRNGPNGLTSREAVRPRIGAASGCWQHPVRHRVTALVGVAGRRAGRAGNGCG